MSNILKVKYFMDVGFSFTQEIAERILIKFSTVMDLRKKKNCIEMKKFDVFPVRLAVSMY